MMSGRTKRAVGKRGVSIGRKRGRWGKWCRPPGSSVGFEADNPISIERQRGFSPRKINSLRRIVPVVVMLWELDGELLGEIAAIFAIKCVGRVFQVADDHDAAQGLVGHDAHSGV